MASCVINSESLHNFQTRLEWVDSDLVHTLHLTLLPLTEGDTVHDEQEGRTGVVEGTAMTLSLDKITLTVYLREVK